MQLRIPVLDQMPYTLGQIMDLSVPWRIPSEAIKIPVSRLPTNECFRREHEFEDRIWTCSLAFPKIDPIPKAQSCTRQFSADTVILWWLAQGVVVPFLSHNLSNSGPDWVIVDLQTRVSREWNIISFIRHWLHRHSSRYRKSGSLGRNGSIKQM